MSGSSPGFKKVFAIGAGEPVTLDYCRQAFESAHGASLADFFQRWYDEPGRPDNGPARPLRNLSIFTSRLTRCIAVALQEIQVLLNVI